MFKMRVLYLFILITVRQHLLIKADISDNFEGDIKLTTDQLQKLKKALINEIGSLDDPNMSNQLEQENALLDTNYRWPDKTLKYKFSDDFKQDPTHTKMVQDTLKNLQEKIEGLGGPGSCVKFVKIDSHNEVDYVHVKDYEKSCHSNVGRVGGPQDLNLGVPGCFKTGVIEHEFLHALGIYHTQSRSDRDKYVEIIIENIEDIHLRNFNSYNSDTVTHYGLPYDYKSVMHYSSKAFSKNKKITIKTKDASKQDIIGKSKGVSELDLALVRKMYDCHGSILVIGGDDSHYKATSPVEELLSRRKCPDLSLPQDRKQHLSIRTVDNVYLVCGGRHNWTEYFLDCIEFDIIDRTWKHHSTLPNERTHSGLISNQLGTYIIGGPTKASKYSVIKLHTGNGGNRWEEYDTIPDHPVNLACVTSVNLTHVIVLGAGKGSWRRHNFLWDISKKIWTTIEELPIRVYRHACIMTEHGVIMVGGKGGDDNYRFKNTYLIQPDSGSRINLADMIKGIESHRLIRFRDTLLTFFGSTVYEYNITTNKWVKSNIRMKFPRYGAASVMEVPVTDICS